MPPTQLWNAVAQSEMPESSAAAPVHCTSIITARSSLTARTPSPTLVDRPASSTVRAKNSEQALGCEGDAPSGHCAQKSALTFCCAGVGLDKLALKQAWVGKSVPASRPPSGGAMHASRPARNAALKLGAHVEQ